MVQVKINDGLLEGDVVQNEYGGTYYSFKGIPYAQPPVGDLRFKPPQPIQPWTGIRNAKEFGPACYQFNMFNSNLNMSEDCLYINVYTPDIKPSKPLPVMVWIHCGGYSWGSGNDDFYGPEFLIRKEVVLVTFNYRLEALGFLCLDSAEIPGNAGMKDQVAALKWVKQNIGYFGGDSDNVTIFGESAGAGSVSYHLVSPMSKGLFRRAILQSGAATCWWSQDFQSRDKTLLLAKQLGCFSEDNQVLYEFFKKQPVEKLIKLKLKIWKAQKPYEIYFAIADEKDYGQDRFFYGDVPDVLQNKIHEGVEIMTGYTKDEGYLTLMICDLEDLMPEAKLYHEFFVPKLIKTHCVIADQLEVGRRMKQFYLKGGDITQDILMKFLATDMFVYGVMLSGKFCAKKNKVYFYKFTCISERNFFAHSMGLSELIKDKSITCHVDDLAYLFPMKVLQPKAVDSKSDTFKLIDRMTNLWTNFAKYGNPTPDKSLGVEWRPYTLEKEEYLDLGNQLKMDTVPDREELTFWENIFKEYLPKYSART